MPEGSGASVHITDLGDVGALAEATSTMFSDLADLNPSEVWLIHNAGSLGQLAPIVDIDPEQLAKSLALNITSPTVLTAQVLQHFQSRQGVKSISVVNISSLAAIQPFDCWGTYCMTKAARNMLHRSIALESETREGGILVRTLNYAPGALDTDMQAEIRGRMPSSSPLAEVFTEMHATGKLLAPSTSAQKLVGLLAEGSFESGTHIDVWDL